MIELASTYEPEMIMQRSKLRTTCALAFALGAMLAIAPATAQKPSWASGSKSDREERPDRRDNNKRDNDREERRADDQRASRDNGRRDHFEDRHRVLVRDFYGDEHRSGRCPPGLAKKHNGCMPPGQAKKWRVGRPLPPDVVFYSLPPAIVVQLGQPPAGHRYVRVAADILLIAIGTGMVVDAIQDLNRM